MALDSNNGSSTTGGSSECLTCQQILAPPPQTLSSAKPASTSDADLLSSSSPAAGVVSLTFTPSQPAWECTFSPCGTWLAVAYGAPNPLIRLWRWQPQRSTTTTTSDNNNNSNPPTNPTTTTTTPSGHWSLHSTLAGIHEKTVRSVDFAPLPNNPHPILASASFDGTVALWEYDNDDNGDWVSTTQLEGHDTEVKCVRWNATASLLATCGRDKSVWIWECFLEGTIGGGGGSGGVGEFECLAVLNGHQGDVKTVQFCPSHGAWGDGDELLLSASYDDTIKCWAEDGGDWYCAYTLSEPNANTLWSLAVSPSGARLVAGAGDGAIRLYKCFTKHEMEQQQLGSGGGGGGGGPQWKGVGILSGAHVDNSPVYSLCYAPSSVGHGRIASGGGDHRIQILREATTSTLERPQFSIETSVVGNHGDVNCVAWHPHDGSILVSAGDDGNVRVWKYECQR